MYFHVLDYVRLDFAGFTRASNFIDIASVMVRKRTCTEEFREEDLDRTPSPPVLCIVTLM